MHTSILKSNTTAFTLPFTSVPSERSLSNTMNYPLGKEDWYVETCEWNSEYIIYSRRNPKELKASILKRLAEEEANSANSKPT